MGEIHFIDISILIEYQSISILIDLMLGSKNIKVYDILYIKFL